jgi:large subunit ribosomal protein L15
MMIHDITSQVGKHKARKRVGRGRASGLGKTSGRGHKGAASRSGYSRRAHFEGGQMTFTRRIPKRGFTNADFRLDYHIVNVQALEARFDAGAEVTPEALVEAGIIRDLKQPLKILGEGDLSKKLTVTANKFSAGAKSKIEAAGGTVNEVVKPKWTRAAAGPSPRKKLMAKGKKPAKSKG